MTASTQEVPRTAERRIRRNQNIRIVLRAAAVMTALAVLVLLVLDNRRQVSAGWVVGDGEVRLYILILVSWAVGLVTGLSTAWRRHRR